jgi:hypothetical protein
MQQYFDSNNLFTALKFIRNYTKSYYLLAEVVQLWNQPF